MKTNLRHIVGMLLVTAILVLCGNAVIAVKTELAKLSTSGAPTLSMAETLAFAWASIVRSLPGMGILIGFTLGGILCKRHIPIQLPAAAYIVTIGCIMSIPGAPESTGPISTFMNSLSGTIMKYVVEVNFMSLTTPVLAYAGLSLAKDLDALKQSGWKLVVVSIFVFIGTFLGSAIIADVVLRLTGQI